VSFRDDVVEAIDTLVGDGVELVSSDLQVDVDNRRNLVRIDEGTIGEFSPALTLSVENLTFSSATELTDVEIIYASLSTLLPANPPVITTSADAFSVTWPESGRGDDFVVGEILVRYHLTAIPEPSTASLLSGLLLAIASGMSLRTRL
jgi:hypothetical protein